MVQINTGISGVMTAVLAKADGTVESVEKHNMILNAGFDFICDAIGNATQPTEMNYIAVGTGSTSVAATQTQLVAEIDRNAASYAHTAGTKVFTLTATFGTGEAVGAITEAGVANASTGGIFLDRVTFPVINKETNDTLTITFTFTLSEV